MKLFVLAPAALLLAVFFTAKPAASLELSKELTDAFKSSAKIAEDATTSALKLIDQFDIEKDDPEKFFDELLDILENAKTRADKAQEMVIKDLLELVEPEEEVNV
ncbi:hypothetical protein BX661DRAFT_176273 [Kickxella alabastrina]|uniref:uncharacterized protein n=1 Tax=Kickxella alabastrina TaxID=61397 RepID=UPI00221E7A7E|nr:uncharacterized protein BX661DRAFT_176273 [Kickxella alabastrina]KAI7835186.1 hypothetical protein BX661DRAFT_176273 [Kickxella alabastrina]KAJ1947588.1 hypothetical protein GGF37_000353 [Kickxella alabastrina]